MIKEIVGYLRDIIAFKLICIALDIATSKGREEIAVDMAYAVLDPFSGFKQTGPSGGMVYSSASKAAGE